MVLIDPHEIHEDFLTVPININIVGWSMHHKGGSPNFIGHKGAHLFGPIHDKRANANHHTLSMKNMLKSIYWDIF